MGWKFGHCTYTHRHHAHGGYGYTPTNKSCSVTQSLWCHSFVLAWPVLAHICQPSRGPCSLVLLLVLVHTHSPLHPHSHSPTPCTPTPHTCFDLHLLVFIYARSGINHGCCCCCHTHSQYSPNKVACLPCHLSGTSITSNYSKQNS